MEFPRIQLQESISIQNLISFHYFEYAKGYVFDGEQHDFWEILYVDKGEVEVRADDHIHTLQQGHMIFHKPEEFHTVSVKHEHKPPNLIVISFECASAAMSDFENKIVALGDRERNMLSLIIQEGFQAFLPPLIGHLYIILNGIQKPLCQRTVDQNVFGSSAYHTDSQSKDGLFNDRGSS